MLEKLTNVRVLDKKMKRQILGGADCGVQCGKDCTDPDLTKQIGGDVSGKQLGLLPPIG